MRVGRFVRDTRALPFLSALVFPLLYAATFPAASQLPQFAFGKTLSVQPMLSLPSPEAKVIVLVPANVMIGVSGTQGDYYQVMHVANERVLQGYVVRSAIKLDDEALKRVKSLGAGRLLSPTVGGSVSSRTDVGSRVARTEVCNEDTASLSLRTRIDSFECQEGLFSKGYEFCDVSVRYQIESSCSPGQSFYKRLRCDIEVETHTAKGIMPTTKYGDDSKSVYIYSTYEAGSLDVRVNVEEIVDPVIRARLKEGKCRLR